jgi:DNA polymerase III alpha subunit
MPDQIDERVGIEMLYRGVALSTTQFDLTPDTQLFQNNCDLLEVAELCIRDESSTNPVEDWLMPREYLDLDVAKYLYDRCETDIQRERVRHELELFRARNLDNMLRLMIYIVDTMEENRVVWGVGRGSSVASYCLYLIGVHHIDSIKYDIPITEFLKEDQHATT